MGHGPAAARISTRSRHRRAENAQIVRRDLLAAAATVVGKYGYAKASIARITKVADVASGTFYLYFRTRQELLDEVLPEIGSKLLEFIHDNTDSSSSGLAYEEQRIRAYFEFCRRNPGFLRIYHEAAIFAPQSYRRHFQRLARGYTRMMKGNQMKGEIPLFDDHEIEALIHILMGARSYLSQLYGVRRTNKSPASLIDVYLKVVSAGVFGKAKAQ